MGRGFDSFFGFYDGGQSYYTHITPCVTATPYIITQRHTRPEAHGLVSDMWLDRVWQVRRVA